MAEDSSSKEFFVFVAVGGTFGINHENGPGRLTDSAGNALIRPRAVSFFQQCPSSHIDEKDFQRAFSSPSLQAAMGPIPRCWVVLCYGRKLTAGQR